MLDADGNGASKGDKAEVDSEVDNITGIRTNKWGHGGKVAKGVADFSSKSRSSENESVVDGNRAVAAEDSSRGKFIGNSDGESKGDGNFITNGNSKEVAGSNSESIADGKVILAIDGDNTAAETRDSKVIADDGRADSDVENHAFFWLTECLHQC